MNNTEPEAPIYQTSETPFADLCHVGGQDFSNWFRENFTLPGNNMMIDMMTLSTLQKFKKEAVIEMISRNDRRIKTFLLMWIHEYDLDRWFKQGKLHTVMYARHSMNTLSSCLISHSFI